MRLHRWLRLCRYSPLLLLCIGAKAEAQLKPAPAFVDGIVLDENLAPVADVTVSLAGTRLRVIAGANGRFQINNVPPGQLFIVLQRLGYAPVTSDVQVGAADTLRLSFTMTRVAAMLDRVTTRARGAPTRELEFEERRSFGGGQFVTAADIERRNVVTTTELFRPLLGVKIVSDRITATRGNVAGRPPCYFKFFVDGMAIRTPSLNTDVPTPSELYGVEVYTTPGTIPPQYKTMDGGGYCGVVLMWTKSGSPSS